MPPALTARLAGLPRWAWILILGSGLIMGLFLRKRNLENEAAGVDPSTEGDATGEPVPLDYADPSVIGASAIPAGGAGGLTPVASPMLPEGYPEAITDLTGALVAIATNRDNANADRAVAAINNPPPTSPTSVVTGGGPPPMVMQGTRLSNAAFPRVPKSPPKPKPPKVEKTRCHGGYVQYYWHNNWHTAKPDGSGQNVKCGTRGRGPGVKGPKHGSGGGSG